MIRPSEEIEADALGKAEPGTVAERAEVVSHKRAVVMPIPRRKQLKGRRSTGPPALAFKQEGFHPSLLLIIRRMAFWTWQLLGLGLLNLGEVIILRGSVESRAKRLRRMLQKLGPTAIKFGQQLSQRADVLDPIYCLELDNLLDSVPPFPTEQAIKILERTYGRPIAGVFRVFDPVPIGSASIACVYQAELLTGEKVAVKIRRPRIGEEMVADLIVMSWQATFWEALAIVRPGVASSFTQELRRMLSEELDFVVEARYTELFRKEAKKCKYVTAPRLYHDLCSHQIIVSEFVSGAFLNEFLIAVQNPDGIQLTSLLERGFKLGKISRRLAYIFFWEVFESNFFHADPHPGNIIVKPDNTLVMIDFGSCGTVSRKFRRNLMEFYQMLLAEDLNGVCKKMLATAEPLPPIDTDRCIEELLNLVRNWFFALKSKRSKWQEKCSGSMFLRMISICGKFGITSRPEAVRFFRANFLYDSMIYRLHPDLDGPEEFRRYYKQFAKRVRRRMQKAAVRRLLGPMDLDYVEFDKLRDVGQQVLGRIEDYVDTPKFSYSEGVGKVSYVLSLFIKTAFNLVVTMFFLTLGRMGYLLFWGAALDGREFSPMRIVGWVLSSRLFQFFGFALLVVVARKILIRLDRVEIRD